MNQDQIDQHLSALSRIESPPAPDLRSAVRAEIARRRGRSPFQGWIQALFNWNELLGQPGIAVGAVAVALAIGSLPAFMGHFGRHSQTEVAQARQSLHLDIFSPVRLLPTATGTPSLDR